MAGDPRRDRAPEPISVLVAGSTVLEHLQTTDVDPRQLRGQVVEAMQRALGAYR